MKSPIEATHIPLRWQTPIRVAWIVLALFYIGITVGTMPSRLAPAQVETKRIQGWPGWTEGETRAAFAELGLEPEDYAGLANRLDAFLPFIYFALALFIFSRRPDDWMALATSLVFLTFLLTGPFGELAKSNPIWNTVENVTSSITTAGFFAFFALFPNGRFVPRWIRFVLLWGIGVSVWRIFFPDEYARYAFTLAGPPFLLGPAAQVYRYLRVSSLAERQSIKWVVFGLAAGLVPLGVVVSLTFFILPGVFLAPHAPGVITLLLGSALWSLFLIIMPLSFTLAIVRSRLFDIDVVIRRTLIYGALSALLLVFYFGGVVVLQQLFRAITGQGQDLAIILSTLAIAAISVPLRNRVQEAIDRRFYRRKYDAAHVLQTFAAAARDEVDLSRLTDNLMGVVEETMQPESVSVWLRRSR